jgi:predicted Zn-dependent peptidase
LEVIKEILSECDKLTKEKISLRELDKVKSFLIGNTKLSLEATDDIANFYAIVSFSAL